MAVMKRLYMGSVTHKARSYYSYFISVVIYFVVHVCVGVVVCGMWMCGVCVCLACVCVCVCVACVWHVCVVCVCVVWCGVLCCVVCVVCEYIIIMMSLINIRNVDPNTEPCGTSYHINGSHTSACYCLWNSAVC